MRTYISTPASLAALARSKFKSKSILRWLAKPPAAARVVARPEKRILGAGVWGKSEGQEEGSGEVMGVSLGEASGCGSGLRV